MILLLAITGGMLGKMTDEKYDGFNLILTVIAVLAIVIYCIEVLGLIKGHFTGSYTLDIIGFTVGVVLV